MAIKKLFLGLDLDETLISSIPSAVKNQIDATDRGYDFIIPDIKMKRETGVDVFYYVSERPHLKEFIDFALSNFNVFVYSRASYDYVHEIIRSIGLNSVNVPVFTRDDCVENVCEGFTFIKKDLNAISDILLAKIDDIYFIDDVVCERQITVVKNLIKAPEYNANDSDSYLKDLILELKKALD